MANSSLTVDASGGFNPATFSISPLDHWYVAGLTVVDGYVTSVSVRSTKQLYETSGSLPSGVSPAPSGIGTLSGAFSATNYDTIS